MILSFLRVEYYSIVHMLRVFMHHLLMDVGCFHVLAIVNRSMKLLFKPIRYVSWFCHSLGMTLSRILNHFDFLHLEVW